jgi:hypothetical protein
MTKTAATSVAHQLIRNITQMHPAAPRRERPQCTLNSGRNDGLFRKLSTPAATLSTA